MGWKRSLAVAGVMTFGMGLVSAPAMAADSCRTTCNNAHIDCAKSKSEDVCLPRWTQCKQACNGGAVKQTIGFSTAQAATPAPKPAPAKAPKPKK